MKKTCISCKEKFEPRGCDLSFYERLGVPVPIRCAECRFQNRTAFRNERRLYKRKCDLTNKEMISIYSDDKPFKIFHHEEWWGDKWDGLDYGQDFNPNKSFFKQMQELQLKVPRMSMLITHCENSDYSPYSVYSKDTFMCQSVYKSEDMYYCYQVWYSRDCVDCALSQSLELCYECIYGINLYNCIWTINCTDCADLYFCRDCQNCSNCIGCINLKDKSYHLFNNPVSKEVYNNYVKKLGNSEELLTAFQKFKEFNELFPCRENHNINVENVKGDNVRNSKNSCCCYESDSLEDCSFVYNNPDKTKDCHDCHYSPRAEMTYNAMSAVNNYKSSFVLHSWDNTESSYIDECFYSDHLFGCIGLKHKKYCILNKQYTKEKYEELKGKIIKHMQKSVIIGNGISGTSGPELGEFFPIQMSPFAYNETVAHEAYPLTREMISEKGYKWKDKDETKYQQNDNKLPDSIKDATDQILEETYSCKDCGKNYQIIKKELELYKKWGIAIRRKCPECRHKMRMRFRTSRKLWKRKCAQCSEAILTTYDPKRPETVYCEKCFLEKMN